MEARHLQLAGDDIPDSEEEEMWSCAPERLGLEG